MPVMEWRGRTLRLDPDGSELTMGQAKVIKRATGLRLVAFQTAIQEMVTSQDLDPDLMCVFLWLILEQNGVKTDISELDDVSINELVDALASVVADETPAATVDPTQAAAVSVPPPNGSTRSSSTPISTANEPNISSNSHTTAGSAL